MDYIPQTVSEADLQNGRNYWDGEYDPTPVAPTPTGGVATPSPVTTQPHTVHYKDSDAQPGATQA